MNDSDVPPLVVDGDIADTPTLGYQGGQEFFVDRPAVVNFSGLLGRVTGRTYTYQSFVDQNTEVAGGTGWINDLSGAHDHVIDETRGWVTSLTNPTLSGTTDALVTAARTFRDVDAANARNIDARVSEIDVVLEAEPGRSNLRGMYESLGLDFTSVDREFRDVNTNVLGGELSADVQTDFVPEEPPYAPSFGLAGGMRDAIKRVTGFLSQVGLMDGEWDPYERTVEPVTGDWEGLARAGEALRMLGASVGREAANIDQARYQLEPFWRGRSADASVVMLGDIVAPMRSAAEALDAIAVEYDNAAQGAADFRAVVESLVDAIIEAVVILAIAIAAGLAAAGPTGGLSTVVAGLIGGAEVAVLVNAISRIADGFGLATQIVTAARSSMNNFGGLESSDMPLPELPDGDPASSPLAALPNVGD